MRPALAAFLSFERNALAPEPRECGVLECGAPGCGVVELDALGLESPEREAFERLHASLVRHSPLALAFSGGLDSRFLAHAAALLHRAGVVLRLFHITGPHVPEEETLAARQWAETRGLPLLLLPVDPLALEGVRSNSPQRCYHCKKELFSRLRKAVNDRPELASYTVCDGTNADDSGMYRPGLRALEELGIQSPLAEAGMGKALIRSLGRKLGLDNPEQAARPCLLTRFAYDVPASSAALHALAAAEARVAALLAGWAGAAGKGRVPPDFRLRLTGLGRGDAGMGKAAHRMARTNSAAPTGPGRGMESTAPESAKGNVEPFGPGNYDTELHLSADVGPLWLETLAAAVTQAGFQTPGIRIMAELQGFYDKTRP